MRALITGASSGIGRDMARYLAQKGYDLVVVARRADRLQELKEELSGVDVKCITADLSKTDECKRVYEETKGVEIDMLINNAGFGLAGDFVDTDLDTELMMVDTNVKALHVLTKLYLKDFVKRDSGTILNVASIAGFMPGPLLATYYATKNYVLRLTQAIYKELKKKGSKVKVSALCPGPINTEFFDVANVKFLISGVSSPFVAKLAVDKALKGKLIILPGIVKFVPFLLRLVPQKLVMSVLYKFQSLRRE
ncbi:MAG: SDR family oxidoreductase [Ruminococcaceae bacterium]|nr:SDR family oxidoreductase [Oscillospiraceae bacterium]